MTERVGRHRHVVRQERAEGDTDQYKGRCGLVRRGRVAPRHLCEDERRVLGGELSQRRLAQRRARPRADVLVLQRVDVTLGLQRREECPRAVKRGEREERRFGWVAHPQAEQAVAEGLVCGRRRG